MKLLTVLTLLLATLVTTAALAADPEGFAMYSAAEIQSKAAAAKLDANKAAGVRLGAWGNHNVMIVRRDGDGASELHKTQVDVVMVVSGEGTLVVGGTMVGGKNIAPNEIRGTSIAGGVRKSMAVGDVFHIPADTPHQMLVPKHLVAVVTKIDSK